MNGCGKSDSLIIPEKCPNKGSGYLQSAEGVEERRLAEGNLVQQNKSRTQGREILQNELNRIRHVSHNNCNALRLLAASYRNGGQRFGN